MQHRARARAGSPGARYLDPAVLARIDNLDLLARTVVDGFLHGLHRSPYLGLSMEFAEHRAYMPGDDIRRIDWRLFARTDRHYVKQYEAETNANVAVALDVSRSMGWGSGEVTKLDYARYLAACLTYFSRRQRDRVGLYTFDHEIVGHVPPSVRHMDQILHTLDRAEAGRFGALATPLLRVAETFRRRGILSVVSDLYEEPEAVLAALRPVLGRRHDVVVFHVLDPAELDFPYEAAGAFEDLETGEQMPVVPAKLRDEYRERVRAHSERLSSLLTGARTDYVLLRTDQPLDLALFRYLLARERAAGSRGSPVSAGASGRDAAAEEAAR